MTSKDVYLGHLRTENTHLASGATYITDAPVDNHGKGEAFSPTDTVATGAANCMLTVMGIKAQGLEVDLTGATAQVTKHMTSGPRRISRIEIQVTLPGGVSEKNRKILEQTGRTCPVILSLHEAIEKEITFLWQD